MKSKQAAEPAQQNLKYITCMEYACEFEDPDTFLPGHNQLCIPAMYKKTRNFEREFQPLILNSGNCNIK